MKYNPNTDSDSRSQVLSAVCSIVLKNMGTANASSSTLFDAPESRRDHGVAPHGHCIAQVQVTQAQGSEHKDQGTACKCKPLPREREMRRFGLWPR